MEISEVRVKLVARSTERLRAFCSITLDGDFVVRDLKIIDGTTGPFVAMPSRKLADRCPRCGYKNHLRAKFCNDCGCKLNDTRASKDGQGRAKLHADVAHPINAACRERIQQVVIDAYQQELEKAKSPDYQPPDFDDFDDVELDGEPAYLTASTAATASKKVEIVDDADNTNEGGDDFSDYNSLIADLKREAQGRRGKREREESAAPVSFSRLPSIEEDESAEESAAPVESKQPTPDRPVESRPAPRPAPASAPSTAAKPSGSAQPHAGGDDFGAGLF